MLFVSAFWHGVYPGYYVTFMSVPLMIFSDSQFEKLVKPYLSNSRQHYYFEWVRWFCLYRTYEYLSVGFIMLKLDVVWTVFKANYFIGHIIMIIVSILPFIVPRRRPPVNKDAGSNEANLKGSWTVNSKKD